MFIHIKILKIAGVLGVGCEMESGFLLVYVKQSLGRKHHIVLHRLQIFQISEM